MWKFESRGGELTAKGRACVYACVSFLLLLEFVLRIKISIPCLSHTVQQVQQESVHPVLLMEWLLRHDLVARGFGMDLMGVLQCVRNKQCTRVQMYSVLRKRIIPHVRLDKRSAQVPDIFWVLQQMSSLFWRNLQSH